ncbi:hypothetical protein AGMMS50212_00170 [Spirochaetia bacterium]|nr:hypothetical protein AGMMS50212_00170 [Spirochaetia bacterium]
MSRVKEIGHITINCIKTENRGDTKNMEISLADDDSGVRPENLEKLFDIFYRADQLESDGVKGGERALTSDFDLLLLDLMLPGIDSYTICRAIQNK